MKPFNLEEALAGKPVLHIQQEQVVSNLTRVGNSLAFQLPGHTAEPDRVFYVDLNGFGTTYAKSQVLAMFETKLFVTLWDSPSFHYTKYTSYEAATKDTGFTYMGRIWPKLNKEPIEIT